jgi:hypothetical protein
LFYYPGKNCNSFYINIRIVFKIVRIHNYSSLEVIAGDTKNRTQTIIHVQITVKMWGSRIKSKKRDKSRQVFVSFHPMSCKEAKGDSLASPVHSILSNYFLFGFPAKFKYIVTSVAILWDNI